MEIYVLWVYVWIMETTTASTTTKSQLPSTKLRACMCDFERRSCGRLLAFEISQIPVASHFFLFIYFLSPMSCQFIKMMRIMLMCVRTRCTGNIFIFYLTFAYLFMFSQYTYYIYACMHTYMNVYKFNASMCLIK